MEERMAPKVIAPRQLTAPLGLYSHGMVVPAGELVIVAGQVGTGPSGGVAGDIVAQSRQALENVRAVVEAAGCTMHDVVRLQTFLTRAEDIPGFLKARQEVFAEHLADGPYPPNTLLIVSRLVRPEFLVEIEAMATRRAHAAPAGRGASSRRAGGRPAQRASGRAGSARAARVVRSKKGPRDRP
jgi:enamine deaminase RidA (YjgF/YER057c/UK114 family)